MFFRDSEARVQQEFDAQNQQLSAQLSLATELFKRRFDSYETLYTQLINLNEKLLLQGANSAANHSKSRNVKSLAATNRQIADLLAQLDKLNQENALHLSDEVFNLMSDAWKAPRKVDWVGDRSPYNPWVNVNEAYIKSLDLIEEAGAFSDWWLSCLTAMDPYFTFKLNALPVFAMRKVLAPLKRLFFRHDAL